MFGGISSGSKDLGFKLKGGQLLLEKRKQKDEG